MLTRARALVVTALLAVAWAGDTASAAVRQPTLVVTAEGLPAGQAHAGNLVTLAGSGWIAQVERADPESADPEETDPADPGAVAPPDPAVAPPDPAVPPPDRAVSTPDPAVGERVRLDSCEVQWSDEWVPDATCVIDATTGTLSGSFTVPAVDPADYVVRVCRFECDGTSAESRAVVTVVEPTVVVPVLAGQTYDEATLTLTSAGLLLAPDVEPPGDREAVVTAQDPAALDSVPHGATVRVTFEEPDPPVDDRRVTVPDLSGLSLDGAAAAAGADGLRIEVAASGDATGAVVGQDPAAGALVEPGTPVVVVLLAPPDGLAPVPDVVGMSAADAERAVEQAGFIFRAATLGGDRVESQNPAAGTRAGLGSVVGVQLTAPSGDSSPWPILAGGAVLLLTVGALIGRAASRSGRTQGWIDPHVSVDPVAGRPTYRLDAPPGSPTVRLVPHRGSVRSTLEEAARDHTRPS